MFIHFYLMRLLGKSLIVDVVECAYFVFFLQDAAELGLYVPYQEFQEIYQNVLIVHKSGIVVVVMIVHVVNVASLVSE